jgi:CheY-like chemotaxis protein
MAPKVLLVDDEVLMHRLYRRYVEEAGYQLLTAATGAEAVELAVRELPGVIIMDIMMPDMDGFSAIREIRRHAETKNIPLIAITANPEYYVSQQESQWAGAMIFLTKPFGQASLISAIRQLLPLKEPS